MLLLRPRQVGTASSAARTEAVAESAVDAELVFSGFRRLGVTRKGVVIVGGNGDSRCDRYCQQRD
jgi:hypothetical protein